MSPNGASAPLQPSPSLTRMEQVVQFYISNKQFMGSVLVARGEDVLLNKGYGFANLEWEIPNSPSTKFRLGERWALEERGKLNVDDPVKEYMPDAPAAWDKITIFNLLTHTSGIPSFTDSPDYASLKLSPATPQQLLSCFRDRPLDFQLSRFEVFPESEVDYFPKVVDAQATFVTDGKGRATELILHQDGYSHHAKRIE